VTIVARFAQTLAEALRTADPCVCQRSWYGDSAYGTGDLRDAIGKAGHQAVIKPILPPG
jgi:hypothetical protein